MIAVLLLATAMHLDWHVARPAHHRLSLGWSQHWLLAIPVFAFLAWYVHRAWPENRTVTSVAIVGTALLLAGLGEPGWEYWIEKAPWEWAFGQDRVLGLARYALAGIATLVIVITILSSRSRISDRVVNGRP